MFLIRRMLCLTSRTLNCVLSYSKKINNFEEKSLKFKTSRRENNLAFPLHSHSAEISRIFFGHMTVSSFWE